MMNEETNPTIEATQKLMNEMGTYSAVGKHLGINPAHVWKAVNLGKTPAKLTQALVQKGLIAKPAPKDPRQRTWMRTDDLALAVATLKKHYPQVREIILDNAPPPADPITQCLLDQGYVAVGNGTLEKPNLWVELGYTQQQQEIKRQEIRETGVILRQTVDRWRADGFQQVGETEFQRGDEVRDWWEESQRIVREWYENHPAAQQIMAVPRGQMPPPRSPRIYQTILAEQCFWTDQRWDEITSQWAAEGFVREGSNWFRGDEKRDGKALWFQLKEEWLAARPEEDRAIVAEYLEKHA